MEIQTRGSYRDENLSIDGINALYSLAAHPVKLFKATREGRRGMTKPSETMSPGEPSAYLKDKDPEVAYVHVGRKTKGILNPRDASRCRKPPRIKLTL